MKPRVCLVLTAVALAAQVPPGWNQRTALGSDRPGQGIWTGAGAWAGNHQGGAATLTDSLGLGNALTGGGFHVEGGYRSGPWDLAAEVLGVRSPQGQTLLTLYRSHLWYRGGHGWQGGFEQEPLVWGYGLNGGYVLGEAARPFPRLRVASPMADLHLGPIPLGAWGWQMLLGRLERHPALSTVIPDPSVRSRVIAAGGTPSAPLVSGYRIQAEFGPLMEFYLNTLVEWGGTLNGVSMLRGYHLGDDATAMLGIKDGLAEAGRDFSEPGPMVQPMVNAAQSSTEIDVGFRLQTPALSRAVGADASCLYLSRGSKSGSWPIKVLLKNPVQYLAKDLSRDVRQLANPGRWGDWWNTPVRYTAPSQNQANDTLGVLVAWPGVRAGLEYFACADAADVGITPFANTTYLTGFYAYGDPLGNAVGGEAVTTSARLEVDFTPRLTGATTVMRGFRPFRDHALDWALDHPGQAPGKNRFTVVQQVLEWQAGTSTTLGLGVSWQRQGAVLNAAGAGGSGIAWFADAAFRWPERR